MFDIYIVATSNNGSILPLDFVNRPTKAWVVLGVKKKTRCPLGDLVPVNQSHRFLNGLALLVSAR